MILAHILPRGGRNIGEVRERKSKEKVGGWANFLHGGGQSLGVGGKLGGYLKGGGWCTFWCRRYQSMEEAQERGETEVPGKVLNFREGRRLTVVGGKEKS